MKQRPVNGMIDLRKVELNAHIAATQGADFLTSLLRRHDKPHFAFGTTHKKRHGQPLAVAFGFGLGTTIDAAVASHLLALLIFGIGRLLGFLEGKAGVRQDNDD